MNEPVTPSSVNLTEMLSKLAVASAVIGNLPELPGYNGSVLAIDDTEAASISSDLDEVHAAIAALAERTQQEAQDDDLIPLGKALDAVAFHGGSVEIEAHLRSLARPTSAAECTAPMQPGVNTALWPACNPCCDEGGKSRLCSCEAAKASIAEQREALAAPTQAAAEPARDLRVILQKMVTWYEAHGALHADWVMGEAKRALESDASAVEPSVQPARELEAFKEWFIAEFDVPPKTNRFGVPCGGHSGQAWQAWQARAGGEVSADCLSDLIAEAQSKEWGVVSQYRYVLRKLAAAPVRTPYPVVTVSGTSAEKLGSLLFGGTDEGSDA